MLLVVYKGQIQSLHRTFGNIIYIYMTIPFQAGFIGKNENVDPKRHKMFHPIDVVVFDLENGTL